MPKMSVGRFLKNPIAAVSNAWALNHEKDRIRALDAEARALERELEFAVHLERVETTLDGVDVAARACYDLLTSVLGKLQNLPEEEARAADFGEENERFCALLNEACAATRRSAPVEGKEGGDMMDEFERDARVCALLDEYRDCVFRKAETHARDASPFRHRLYRYVDRQLSELHEFRDELRKQSQIQFKNAEELKRVKREIEEAEEKLSALRRKQFG